MKRQLLTYALLAGVVCSISSCKKEQDPPATVKPVKNAADFVARYGPEKQLYSLMTSDLPLTMTLKNGVKVSLPQSGLQRNGYYVSGYISVEAYEFLKRSDMILGGINTDHFDGAPIQSNGILFIDVKSNGQSVDPNLANTMRVSVPSSGSGYAKICTGNPNVNGTQQLAWGPQMIDSINSDGGTYTYNTQRLGWLNCGTYFAPQHARGTLTVTLENNPGAIATCQGATGNTFVYFCPKGSMVAMQLYAPAGDNKVKSYDNAMPVGIEGRLISFSVKDDKYYYADKEVTTSNEEFETLTLQEVSVSDLQLKIRALDAY